MLSVNMLSVFYAKCHKKHLHTKCHYAECRYADCCVSLKVSQVVSWDCKTIYRIISRAEQMFLLRLFMIFLDSSIFLINVKQNKRLGLHSQKWLTIILWILPHHRCKLAIKQNICGLLMITLYICSALLLSSYDFGVNH
jgi:hypothetical protein